MCSTFVYIYATWELFGVGAWKAAAAPPMPLHIVLISKGLSAKQDRARTISGNMNCNQSTPSNLWHSAFPQTRELVAAFSVHGLLRRRNCVNNSSSHELSSAARLSGWHLPGRSCAIGLPYSTQPFPLITPSSVSLETGLSRMAQQSCEHCLS